MDLQNYYKSSCVISDRCQLISIVTLQLGGKSERMEPCVMVTLAGVFVMAGRDT